MGVMNQTNALDIAKAAFAEIQARFPSVQMIQEPDAPVEFSLNLPVQPGLSQKVWLGFQNGDELHFSVGHFWFEWFPCTQPLKVGEYVKAVTGFLSGQYRVVEYLRGGRCVKAKLQAPDNSGWQTVATWSNLWALFPGRRESRVLRNDAQQGVPADRPRLASLGSSGR